MSAGGRLDISKEEGGRGGGAGSRSSSRGCSSISSCSSGGKLPVPTATVTTTTQHASSEKQHTSTKAPGKLTEFDAKDRVHFFPILYPADISEK